MRLSWRFYNNSLPSQYCQSSQISPAAQCFSTYGTTRWLARWVYTQKISTKRLIILSCHIVSPSHNWQKPQSLRPRWRLQRKTNDGEQFQYLCRLFLIYSLNQRQPKVMCYLLTMKSFAKAAMICSFLSMAGIHDSADQNERVVFWPWTLKNSDNVYWDKSTIFGTLPQGTGALVSQW